MTETSSSSLRIGDYLIQKGIASEEVVEAAAMEASITGERVGAVLVRNGFIRHSDLVQAILDLAPDRISVEKVYNSNIPRDLLAEYKIVIVAETDHDVYISTLSSQDQAQAVLESFFPHKRLKFVPLAARDIDDFLEAASRAEEETEIQDDALVLDSLLSRSIKSGASDIHIEPRNFTYTVFFRHLGVRQIVHEGPLQQYGVLAAQVKDRARMDQVETRIPQDGSFAIETMGRVVDARVATVPTVNGEIIVIRLLDPDTANVRLPQLGISRVDEWRVATGYPFGLCLVCGATGSGKTTTLNASIKEMDRFGRAIRTVEEPVEYRIPYVGQVNVNRIVGLDFAQALRAFMRADPDVIILGEIRDQETSTLTLRAAETGHLVIATLHTGSVRGAFGRMKALGVTPLDLQPLLRGVLVQRLVRTVCPACGGVGCELCLGTGYAGRTVVSECVAFRAESQVERALAGERWWPTMVEDALKKINDGVTTIEEIRRVFHSELENPEFRDDESIELLRALITEQGGHDD